MATRQTIDEMAVQFLLEGNRRGLQRLRASVTRPTCPFCGSIGPHDDNGEPPGSGDYTLLCRDCNEQWMPNDR